MKLKKNGGTHLKKREFSQEKESKDFLKKSILEQTEAKIKDKYSDESLDREFEKRKLLCFDFRKQNNIEKITLKEPSKYEIRFPQEYYQEIFRLNNWKFDGKISRKPWIVGTYTNKIIYYRFSYITLNYIRKINPYITSGKRKYKHHQYLTQDGQDELNKFISEATEIMKKCSSWHEFQIKHCKMYSIPYQGTFFS